MSSPLAGNARTGHQRAAALGTTRRRAASGFAHICLPSEALTWRRAARLGFDLVAAALALGLACMGIDADVAHRVLARLRHVREQLRNKPGCGEAAHLVPSVAMIAIAETYLATVRLDDAGVRDRAAAHVA